jgi:alpha/beta superfamily hydrolase
MTSPVTIPSPSGSLEGLLEIPPAYTGEWASVICHPHPLYGGTMRHKVPARMAAALRACGAATLRFNFRGVGRSSGIHDNGRGEEDDVRAAWTFIREKTAATRLVLGGFSFGAWVALKASAGLPDLRYLLAVGCPADLYDCSFVVDIRVPLLLVQGREDQFGDEAAVAALARLNSRHVSTAIIDGADHTFTRKLTPLTSAVIRHFQPRLAPSSRVDSETPRPTGEE